MKGVQEKKIEKLNILVEKLLNLDPLTSYVEKGPENVQEMNYALAQMYALKGFRDYLELNIRRQIHRAAIHGEDVFDGVSAKARILTLKELLVNAKTAFNEYNKIVKKVGIKDTAEIQEVKL